MNDEQKQTLEQYAKISLAALIPFVFSLIVMCIVVYSINKRPIFSVSGDALLYISLISVFYGGSIGTMYIPMKLTE